ncbi:unnamed protein product [Sympodiomycopsis kandeliae]
MSVPVVQVRDVSAVSRLRYRQYTQVETALDSCSSSSIITGGHTPSLSQRQDPSPNIKRTKGRIKSILKLKFKKKPSSSSADIPSPPPLQFTMPPYMSPPDELQLLDSLPSELQSYLLTFLPVKTLCRGLSQTNKYWFHMIDEYAQRLLTHQLASMSPQGQGRGDEPLNRLCFQAQRPIDTIAHKHTMYFSHFIPSTTKQWSSTAHFVFSPLVDHDVSQEKDQAQEGATEDMQRNRALARGIPESHLDRLRPEHHSSSVMQADSSRRARSRSQSQRGQHTSQGSQRHHHGQHQHHHGEASAVASSSLPTRAEIGDVDLYNPLDAYDWAGPLTSSVHHARSRSRSTSSQTSSGGGHSAPYRRRASSRALAKPTYRMQLDTLDSFETWILTLTLSRTGRNYSPYTSVSNDFFSAPQSIKWERRIAEGLDRVYRDWFKRPDLAAFDEEFSKNLHLKGIPSQDIISAMARVQRYEQEEASHTTGRIHMDDYTSHQPPIRRVEVDTPSAQLILQPHTIPSIHDSFIHPALLSTYSHTYLSGNHSSLSLATNRSSSTQRIEYTFHIEGLEILTTRLVSHIETIAIEMIEWQLEQLQRMHKRQNSSSLTILDPIAGVEHQLSELFAMRGGGGARRSTRQDFPP